jgi:hypothetical protein
MRTILDSKQLAISAGICCLSVLAVSSPAIAGYSAIAQGMRAWGWASGYSTMEKARNEAIRQCRSSGGGSCSVSTAERDSWYFVGGFCNRMPYTAASPHSWQDAADFMRQKGRRDGNFNCYIEVER